MPFQPAEKPNAPLGQHRLLSPTCSLKVSPICLGTMNFGEVWKKLTGECTKETAFSILDRYYSSGGNFLDTANMYMEGESESWIGEWLSLRGCRDEMVIATKYTVPFKFANSQRPGTILSNYGGNNKKSLRLSLQQSLENLKTDYIDILYVHSWEGTTAIEELMRGLDDAVKSGKVLYLGVSNWPAWVVVKANDFARQHGLTPFVVYEGRWNVAEREIERSVLPMCKDQGMGITVWSPLGGGKLKSSTIKRPEDDKGGRTTYGNLGGASDEMFEKCVKALEPIAERKGVTTTTIALRYLTLKAPYVFPICGGRRVDHLQSNIEAINITLSEEELNDIDAAASFDLGYPYSVLSGARDKHVSANNPAAVVRMGVAFEGVEDIKVCKQLLPKYHLLTIPSAIGRHYS